MGSATNRHDKTTVCDMNKMFKTFGREGLNAYMADTAHPNAKSHAAMSLAIAYALAPRETALGLSL